MEAVDADDDAKEAVDADDDTKAVDADFIQPSAQDGTTAVGEVDYTKEAVDAEDTPTMEAVDAEYDTKATGKSNQRTFTSEKGRLSQPDIDQRCQLLQCRISSGMVSAKYREEALDEMLGFHLEGLGLLNKTQAEASEVKPTRLPTRGKAYRRAFPSLWEDDQRAPITR